MKILNQRRIVWFFLNIVVDFILDSVEEIWPNHILGTNFKTKRGKISIFNIYAHSSYASIIVEMLIKMHLKVEVHCLVIGDFNVTTLGEYIYPYNDHIVSRQDKA